MGGKSTTATPGPVPAATPAAQPPAQQNRFGISPEGYETMGRALSSAGSQFGQAMAMPTPAMTSPMNPMAQTSGLTMQFPGGMGRPESRPRQFMSRPITAQRQMPLSDATPFRRM